MTTRIISAAVRGTVNGEYNIFPVHRHADFFVWMKHLHCVYDKNEIEQGFLAYRHPGVCEFVSREEAAKIAAECNQILTERRARFDPNCLYSEDCW